MKFETVQIYSLRDTFGLVSCRDFATMTMRRNNFSPPLPHIFHLPCPFHDVSQKTINDVKINGWAELESCQL